MKAEHPKPKVGGSPKTSYLSDEDISELREREKHVKELELQLREAKLNAELRKLQTVEQPAKEKTWVLPDGTSFQGSSADYRDMLQTYYQVQAMNKKATTETENPTVIKAMLERMADLEKQVSESKMKDIENKLNYIASRDPLENAVEAISRFNKLAQDQGLIKAGTSIADEVQLRHADVQSQAILKGLDTVSKKIDNSMERASKIESEALPLLKKIGDIYLDDFRARRGAAIGEPIPHSEGEIEILATNLAKNDQLQQEIDKSEPENPKPEEKSSSPKMYEYTPRPELHGHDLGGQ